MNEQSCECGTWQVARLESSTECPNEIQYELRPAECSQSNGNLAWHFLARRRRSALCPRGARDMADVPRAARMLRCTQAADQGLLRAVACRAPASKSTPGPELGRLRPACALATLARFCGQPMHLLPRGLPWPELSWPFVIIVAASIGVAGRLSYKVLPPLAHPACLPRPRDGSGRSPSRRRVGIGCFGNIT